MNQEFIAIPTEYNCYADTITNRTRERLVTVMLYD